MTNMTPHNAQHGAVLPICKYHQEQSKRSAGCLSSGSLSTCLLVVWATLIQYAHCLEMTRNGVVPRRSLGAL